MNQTELVTAVAERNALTKTEAGKAVDAVLEAIQQALVGGDDVKILGFGAFSVAAREARQGRNPATGAAIEIAASKAPKFKPAKALTEALNT